MFNHERMQCAQRRPVCFFSRPIHLSRLAALLALVALAVSPRPLAAQRPPARKATNIVYVESNDPGGNAIFAFSRADDGSLTTVARLSVFNRRARCHPDFRTRAV